MGCGASVPSPLTDADKEILCKAAGKDMEVVVVRSALNRKDEIVINPPDCINKYKDTVAKLNEANAKFKDKLEELTGKADNMASAAGGLLGGGKLGGMVSGAASMLAGAGAAAAGAVGGGTLYASAAALQAAIDKVEGDFTDVGDFVVNKQFDKIVAVYQKFIQDRPVDSYVALCRPEGFADPQQEPFSTISDSLTVATAASMYTQLGPVVGEGLKEHKLTHAWKKMDEALTGTYTAIDEAATKLGMSADEWGVKRDDFSFNLEEHVGTNIILELNRLMGGKEKLMRSHVRDPQNKLEPPPNGPKRPINFTNVLTEATLNSNHKKQYEEEIKSKN